MLLKELQQDKLIILNELQIYAITRTSLKCDTNFTLEEASRGFKDLLIKLLTKREELKQIKTRQEKFIKRLTLFTLGFAIMTIFILLKGGV